MNDIFKFLASFPGRLTRIIGGILLAFWGIFANNVFLLVIGMIPLTAGVFDKCVFAPLFKLPFDGPKLRKALGGNVDEKIAPKQNSPVTKTTESETPKEQEVVDGAQNPPQTEGNEGEQNSKVES